MSWPVLTKERVVLLSVAIVSFIFLEAFAYIAYYYVKQNDLKNYLSVASPDFKTHIDIANYHLSDLAHIFYALKVDQESIKRLMYEASKIQEPSQREVIRKRLYMALKPTYEKMKHFGVRQLHFHLPKAISFLRFHRPNRYGDSLVGIRDTIEYVDEHKTAISAFEEGRIFNGFRNVYPIFYKKIFVGSVEISFSFEGMQEVLSKIDSTSYLFMIDKKIVDAKVFNSEKSNYVESEFSGYVYDSSTLKDTMQISLEGMRKINRAIASRVKERLQKGKLFSIIYKDASLYANHSIIISFAPISNLDDRVVAYVIHYSFGTFIDMLYDHADILFVVLTLFALTLSIIVAYIVHIEQKKRLAMHEYAIHDALTGIYNRHGINEMVNQQILESKREKKGLSLIFFDIDFFKHVNDTYGHDMGDFVLKNIAKIVKKEIRSSDIFARWGGEEFILFLPSTELKDGVDVAEKLRQKIASHPFGAIEKVTCSFGVTTLREDESKTEFLKRADTLLYRAKALGRNCVVSDMSEDSNG